MLKGKIVRERDDLMKGNTHIAVAALATAALAVSVKNGSLGVDENAIILPRLVLQMTVASTAAALVDSDSSTSSISKMLSQPIRFLVDFIEVALILLIEGLLLGLLYRNRMDITRYGKYIFVNLSEPLLYLVIIFISIFLVSVLTFFITKKTGFKNILDKMRKSCFLATYWFIAIIFLLIVLFYPEKAIFGAMGVIFFVLVPLFSHRQVIHTALAMFLATSGAYYIFSLLKVPDYTIGFFIGYFSHLYLTDLLTVSGIPLSSGILILKKIGIEKKDNILYKSLNRNIKVPVSKTGTPTGDLIEKGYVIIWIFVLIFLLIINFKTGLSVKIEL